MSPSSSFTAASWLAPAGLSGFTVMPSLAVSHFSSTLMSTLTFSTSLTLDISLFKVDDFILNLHEDCERTLVELRLHLHYLFKLYKNNYQNYNLASRLSYFPFKMSTGCLASLPIFHPRPQYKYFLLLETSYIAEDVHKKDCYI